MLCFEDCLALCSLSEDEILAIMQHEHIPEIVALELAEYLVKTPDGRVRIRRMILDDIEDEERKGNDMRVLELKAVLKHFIDTHPENPKNA